MRSKKIAIIDYGLGNLFSITNALKPFELNVKITADAKEILSSDAVIMPGVGAFTTGAQELKNRDLIKPLKQYVIQNKPMLGICLGAQLMLSKGYEFGEYDGLGIIPGAVKMFPQQVIVNEKIPHIGWNGIYPPGVLQWEGSIFENIPQNSDVYFVHSYIMIPDSKEDIFAIAQYGELEFCAATRKGNIYGTQFHPEKSGKIGQMIIENFINLIK